MVYIYIHIYIYIYLNPNKSPFSYGFPMVFKGHLAPPAGFRDPPPAVGLDQRLVHVGLGDFMRNSCDLMRNFMGFEKFHEEFMGFEKFHGEFHGI